MIPLGDIDLQKEMHLNNEIGVVNQQYERARVRRVYSARVDGRKSNVTAAMYQGTGAEEVCCALILQYCLQPLQEWRQDITAYMTVRQVPTSIHCIAGH
jgi:hypothetical protein